MKHSKKTDYFKHICMTQRPNEYSIVDIKYARSITPVPTNVYIIQLSFLLAIVRATFKLYIAMKNIKCESGFPCLMPHLDINSTVGDLLTRTKVVEDLWHALIQILHLLLNPIKFNKCL